MTFIKPEHENIAEILRSMDGRFLESCGCYFGGGTAIVLKYGEYRQSLDVDFLCASTDGYRELRVAAQRSGPAGLFRADIKAARETIFDRYGIRMFLFYKDQSVKFEIVREERIPVGGELDDDLGVPVLSSSDMFAEKLLANSDRCLDRSVAYRDAIDLGRLVMAHGEIPSSAVAKAQRAYGESIEHYAVKIVNHLRQKKEVRHAAEVLQMHRDDAFDAIAALRADVRRLWPDGGVEDEPEDGYDNSP
ncbi:nucleotidyl transferase AbiEii/AbiGii toxin family protein [Mycoplana dimorpha]|uniref:Nucleotidyltransferase AbiEii toxin of type IV toxin-antitoxin system n=1 Tax=Mycoplana dimorpha TaxID=28320 RepID=A0A2T5AGH4_MYCDI|nr:nucleotidyl transferase AbiEii/AbiGii toxin family protein [Mycoplana dimorpha]PTM85820.1 nucleotidyltransferase AbiEii toxin of type IV toxin-antitoxin system [Mycoplana dimorpha]